MAAKLRSNYYGSMWKQSVTLPFLAIMAALISGFVAAAETNAVSVPLRARQLEGMKVEDLDGQPAGTVRNLVLNLSAGNLRYVVIGGGGYLGLHSTLKLAPAQVMTAATAKSETLAIDATTVQWRNAPSFKYSTLAAISQPDRAREISRYFQPATSNSVSGTKTTLSQTSRDPAAATRPAQLQLASDVIGMHVINRKQEKMGEIVDLLVSFGEPHAVFAIVSSGRLLHHDHQFAIPLTALIASDKKLMWKGDSTALQNAPTFDQRAWESSAGDTSGRIYRYSTSAD